ncbi:MAG: beta-lactamase family protein [Clostridiales bacterium]|nr:beta-lactamase family protein [Clostridiales bacterium]
MFEPKRLLALMGCVIMLFSTCASAEDFADNYNDENETTITEEELLELDGALDMQNVDEVIAVESQLATTFREYSTLGASVAVIQNGEITFTYQYGKSGIRGDEVTADTGFQVASISKLVSNIGLMQLVEAGKAKLDDDLSDLFGFEVRNPDYPDTPITLRQLMSHTAGFADHKYYQQALQGKVRKLSEIFTGSSRRILYRDDTKPGSKRHYSNFGGGLIGSLIEKLSGQQLDAYMAEHVFTPLGITASYQPNQLPTDMLLADMYSMPKGKIEKRLRDDAKVVTKESWETAYVYSAGKLVITAVDLAKIISALCDGGIYGDVRILEESTVLEMTKRQGNRFSVDCECTHGLFMNIITDYQVRGRTVYGHGGKANGMLCAAYFDPTDRTGVVMLTNGCENDRAYYGCGLLGRAILRVCYDEVIGDKHQYIDPFLVD